MSPGLWILVIAVGIIIAAVVLIFVIPGFFAGILGIAKWVQHRKYAREARIHNAKARAIRLERTEWNGLPLPTGKEGRLVITEHDLITNPNRISNSQFERVYRDRGLDLKVDIYVSRDVISRDYVITWKPHKGRWPKERY